jgi:RNA polymerase sigma factor (sigma-70 family)
MHDSEVAASIESDRSAELPEAYDRYADPLYKYCLAFLGDPAEAADAVQDTFVVAAARLVDLREPSRLRAWVYAVGRSQCLRAMPPGRPMFAPAPAPYVMAGVANADEDTERARLRDLLDAATAGLAPGEREVIELELRHGLAVAEVASVVGVSRARANTQASRAREHLEAGLAAVVVARAGRRDCRVLSGMLDGWDGHLTVALREQLHRHIGRCAICSTRRDLELHPGRLFGQSPGEALADAAAASLRVAVGPPGALRARTLALAAGQDPDATAHHAAVLGRAGVFDSQGFPKPEPGPEAAPTRGDGGGPARRRGRVAVAAGAAGLVAAAVIGVVAVALADNSGHAKLAAGQPIGSTPPTGPSAAAPFGASPGTTPTSSATPTSTGTGSATTAPQGTPTATNRATTPATPPSATTDPTATGSTGTTGTPTATAKAAPGTLTVSPSGGALMVPPRGTTISLTAHGGPVTWSSTVSSGLGTVHLSPSGGAINAGATVTVTVSASSTASGQQVTIDPGGTVFTIFIEL